MFLQVLLLLVPVMQTRKRSHNGSMVPSCYRSTCHQMSTPIYAGFRRCTMLTYFFCTCRWNFHVFVKLRAIRVPSNTSCKHVRHPFPHIDGMHHHVKFPQVQAWMESFDMVCHFLSNLSCTILILVLLQLKSRVLNQALIRTLKWSNVDVCVIFVTPLRVFGCKPTNCPHGPP